MNWTKLVSEQDLEDLKQASFERPVLLFKHSTRCSISSTVLNRLERKWKQEEMGRLKPFFLDLVAYRKISNRVAEEFGVPHQSPQVLLIENGRCIYDASHMQISYQNLKSLVTG